MDFYGIQKCSLLDYPHKLCATLFTSGCNLRCPFCHNRDLVLNHLPKIPEEEILNFLQKRKGKLQAVCISGGEPCMHPLEEWIDRFHNMGYLVKLDTNGFYPNRLQKLLPNLDYVAMDIKNDLSHYTETCGVPHLELRNICDSITLIMQNAKDYCFRTTVVQELHNEERMENIGNLCRGAKRFYLQTYVPSPQQLGEQRFSPPGSQSMQKYQQILQKYITEVIIK